MASMTGGEKLRDRGVALLAPRMCLLGHDPCGGSEVILWEDAKMLRDAGIPVRVYGSAVRHGTPATALRLRTMRPLITSLEYAGQFLMKERKAFLIAYNEPTLAVLAPERSIVRFDWTSPLPRYWRLMGPLQQFQRALYLFPSRSERDLFLSRHDKIPAKSMAILPNAVDLTQFLPYDAVHDGAPRAGYAGQWAPEKGIRELLRAWEIVRSQLPSAELRMAGGPELWKSIFGSSDSAGTTLEVNAMARKGFVEIAGAFPRNQMPSFWNSVQVAIVPSLHESFGLVALEALACGIPVVATAVGGLKETVVHRESGLLVPPGDSTALASAILDVLTDEDLRKRLAIGARRRAESFSLDARSRGLIELIRHRADRSAQE